ncbi:MAG: vitamin K epoxide reductase family protein [Candidatus Harrisonbacteria bacterium]|nr:vitamin K epoxide reductase family protein [Candidatus Harrisonbacteria bacterium]
MDPISQPTIKKGLFGTFFAFAVFGFLDSAYLTISHFLDSELKCSLIQGCDIVTKSSFSTIGPIPVALVGLAYYLLLIVLLIAYLDRKNTKLLLIASQLTWAGFIASLYFLSVQAFVLRAFCEFCLYSALSSTVLFILGFAIRKQLRRA